MSEENGKELAPIKKTALSNPKLFLHATNDEGTEARYLVSLVNNNPRISVFTNIKSDQTPENSNGRLNANLDLPTFYLFLDLIEEIANGPSDTKSYIENYGHRTVEGVREERQQLLSELWVGKDSNGIVWSSVTMPGRPNIKFEFKISGYHRLFKNGQPISKDAESKAVALSMVKVFRDITANVATDEFVDLAAARREAKEAYKSTYKSYTATNSNNGGGGNNNYRNGNNNYRNNNGNNNYRNNGGNNNYRNNGGNNNYRNNNSNDSSSDGNSSEDNFEF